MNSVNSAALKFYSGKQIISSLYILRYSFKRIKFISILFLLLIVTETYSQQKIFVSSNGFNSNSGDEESPLQSVAVALEIAGSSNASKIDIILKEGTFFLEKPILIHSKDLLGKTLSIKAAEGEKVVLSGGRRLNPDWEINSDGLWVTDVDFSDFDQLFINGERRILARYPDYKEGEILNGYSEDALSKERIARWKNPVGGYIHALHKGRWGGMHYLITGRSGNILEYIGGFQNNRPSNMHVKYRFVENIFEELDSKGEWYVDKEESKLYYLPFENENLNNKETEIVVSNLPYIIQLIGEPDNHMSNVTIENICFAHTRRTFMDDYEQLMRSDWAIHRGAALYLENTSDCIIENCEFVNLGGNALFISKYGFNNIVRGNHFHQIGASAVCAVGDLSVVRTVPHIYGEFITLNKLDRIPGPANDQYPRECIIEDNLIHNIGVVEKQVAGVQIQIAANLTVRHNTIYEVPRAGINIGDGAFGGHIIEYNDLFSTVLETNDHGAFNSWGRDRYWHPNRKVMDSITSQYPELILLDAQYVTLLRNNRFMCAHGWDIDLDDGSSNYHIYNNLCLQGGIKLREGFFRTVENNIMVNNSFHPHVWFKESHDTFRKNIVMGPYAPIGMRGWGDYVDYNIFVSNDDLKRSQQNGTDYNSIFGDIKFHDIESGDYGVDNRQLLEKIGFESFPMNRFGVISANLKSIAKEPDYPVPAILKLEEESQEVDWLDGVIRSVSGLSDQSAYGLPDVNGAIVIDFKSGGLLSKAGILKGDVVRSLNGRPVTGSLNLLQQTNEFRWRDQIKVIVIRDQAEKEFIINIR